MPIPNIQPSQLYRDRLALARVVEKAMAYKKDMTVMIAGHRDFLAANRASANVIEQAMTRMVEARVALTALAAADVQSFIAAGETETLPDGWETGIVATVTEMNKAIAACRALLPVSADGTLATRWIMPDDTVSTKAFEIAEMTGVVAALDGVVKAV